MLGRSATAAKVHHPRPSVLTGPLESATVRAMARTSGFPVFDARIMGGNLAKLMRVDEAATV